MPATFTVSAKQFGLSPASIPTIDVPLPPSQTPSMTLRDLISHVVANEVAAFNKRAEKRPFFRVLTTKELTSGYQTGKFDPAGREGELQRVAEETAVSVALQAFVDGLYFVFVDGEQIEQLDASVAVAAESDVVFLRLVALAGG
ncbi:MAG: hypothetical protein AAF614_25385 [Chloroflexota bacterium]